MRLYKVQIHCDLEGKRFFITYVTWASNKAQAFKHVVDLWEAQGWGRPTMHMIGSVYFRSGSKVAEVARYAEEWGEHDSISGLGWGGD